MSHSLLYYPTIEFRPEDYIHLWSAALFADKIYRIVPPGYELSEPRNIQVLCSTGEIGIPLSPVPYSGEASRRFSDFMRENRGGAAALTLVSQDEAEYIRIHSEKMDVKLLQDIFYRFKNSDEPDSWLYGSPSAVNFYMTFLANYISEKNNLSLWTGSQELWTASTYFLCDGSLQDDFRPEDIYIEPSEGALASVMIPEIFPQNLPAVPPEDILRFREKRRDERVLFLDAVDHLRSELGRADSPDVIRAILADEEKKVSAAVKEYKKSMDILKAAQFGGVLTTVLTIAADVFGYSSNIPDLYTGMLASSGIWAGVLTGILEKKAVVKNNPYTYLAHIGNAFSLFPGSDRMYHGLIPGYNYTLYRGFEEFIND